MTDQPTPTIVEALKAAVDRLAPMEDPFHSGWGTSPATHEMWPRHAVINDASGRTKGALNLIRAALLRAEGESREGETFHARVLPWMMETFGEAILNDPRERNHRFLEEALELVQSLGCTASEAHQLVDYTFGRPVGEPAQEVGGVMVCLAALCVVYKLDMHEAGEVELARIWTMVEKIRAKHQAKPVHSPLPGYVVMGLKDV